MTNTRLDPITKERVLEIIELYVYDEGWYVKAELLHNYVIDEEKRIADAVKVERDRICDWLQDINTNDEGILCPTTAEVLKRIRENKI